MINPFNFSFTWGHINQKIPKLLLHIETFTKHIWFILMELNHPKLIHSFLSCKFFIMFVLLTSISVSTWLPSYFHLFPSAKSSISGSSEHVVELTQPLDISFCNPCISVGSNCLSNYKGISKLQCNVVQLFSFRCHHRSGRLITGTHWSI